MIEAAIAAGFEKFGFSSHSTMPLDSEWNVGPEKVRDYIREVRSLAEEYRDRIRIYCALEADFIPGRCTPDRSAYASLGLDYLIGSLHGVVAPNGEYLCVDHTPEILEDGLRRLFGGDIRSLIVNYHELLREMVTKYDFDVIGHPDLYRKYNLKHPLFDETSDWYRAELVKSADAIAASGKIVEVNTGAIGRKWRDDAYPSDEFRTLLRERGVKFILDSDTHSVDSVDAGYAKYLGAEDYVDFPR